MIKFNGRSDEEFDRAFSRYIKKDPYWEGKEVSLRVSNQHGSDTPFWKDVIEGLARHYGWPIYNGHKGTCMIDEPELDKDFKKPDDSDLVALLSD